MIQLLASQEEASMAHGNTPRHLILLGRIWSYLLLLIRPILILISAKFRERENGVQSQTLTFRDTNANRSIWIHTSSLGEFEQARPIIENIKKRNPHIDVTVTFFSPSGYRIRHDYEYANRVLYLPLDTKGNAMSFIQHIKPDIILFIRYELWLNYLLEAKKQAIPVYAVNATFPRSSLWRILPGILKSIIELFSGIYTVNSVETHSFASLNAVVPVYDGHDTRIDRIHEKVSMMRTNHAMINELLPGFDAQYGPTIVLGSSWPEDETIFLKALASMNESLRLIIVPHEPDHEHCLILQQSLPNSILLSECDEIGTKHVIVDSIGALLAVYAIADAAFIGGGFGAGVHSCAEPAGYGIPLACGPFISRSPDAEILHEQGALEIIRNVDDAKMWLKAICADVMKKAGEASFEYIESRRGMTDIILRDIIGIND